MTMGTASTMTAAAEALGMTLPGASCTGCGLGPPPHGRRERSRIVEMARGT